MTKSNYMKAKNRHPWVLHGYACKYRCTNPNRKSYCNYGGKGIEFLLTNNELKELWFRDKAYELDRPSLDRENPKLNYIFNNCQFIEHTKNCGKDHKKIILQFDKEENFLKEWKSIKEAGIYYKVNPASISHTLLGDNKTCKGFIWKYKEI